MTNNLSFHNEASACRAAGSEGSGLRQRLGFANSVDMSEKDLQNCRAAFQQLQKSDLLPVQLLPSAYKLLQLRCDGVHELVQEYVQDGVKDLEFFDFATLACSRRSQRRRDTHAALSDIFRLIDSDKDGYISVSELGNALSLIGELDSEEKALAMVAQCSNENRVSFQQFMNLMHQADLD